MVTSGNSSRSSERTSPMERWARSATTLSLAHTGEEDEPELPDLNLVAVVQRAFVNAFPVDVGPVQGAGVAHEVHAALAYELGMATGNGDVVKEDVALRVTPGLGLLVLQHKARAGIGAALYHEDAEALGDLVHGDRDLVVGLLARRLDGHEGDGRRVGLVVAAVLEHRAAG